MNLPLVVKCVSLFCPGHDLSSTFVFLLKFDSKSEPDDDPRQQLDRYRTDSTVGPDCVAHEDMACESIAQANLIRL